MRLQREPALIHVPIHIVSKSEESLRFAKPSSDSGEIANREQSLNFVHVGKRKGGEEEFHVALCS